MADNEDTTPVEDEDYPEMIDFTKLDQMELVSLVRDMIENYDIQGELYYVPALSGYKFIVGRDDADSFANVDRRHHSLRKQICFLPEQPP